MRNMDCTSIFTLRDNEMELLWWSIVLLERGAAAKEPTELFTKNTGLC